MIDQNIYWTQNGDKGAMHPVYEYRYLLFAISTVIFVSRTCQLSISSPSFAWEIISG